MADFGRIPNALRHGAAAISLTQCAVAGTAKASATGIVNDSAVAAVTHAVDMQAARTRQNIGIGDSVPMSAETMKDFVQAVKEKIAELIALFEQMSSLDDFPLGASKGTDPLNTAAKSGLPQSVEQHIAQANADSELGIFSLARIKEHAMRALRCQDPQADRVLSLLKDP